MNRKTTIFKKMKHQIVHPYKNPFNPKKIEVDIEGETFNGVPHGLCFIYFVYNGEFDKDYKDYKKPKTSSTDIYRDGQWYTFRGFGTFNQGVLSNGPSLFVDGNGGVWSYRQMENGRPSGLGRRYYDHGELGYVGGIDYNNRCSGYGRLYYSWGDVCDGVMKDNDLVDGKLYKPNKDGTHDCYEVKDKKEGACIQKSVKLY